MKTYNSVFREMLRLNIKKVEHNCNPLTAPSLHLIQGKALVPLCSTAMFQARLVIHHVIDKSAINVVYLREFFGDQLWEFYLPSLPARMNPVRTPARMNRFGRGCHSLVPYLFIHQLLPLTLSKRHRISSDPLLDGHMILVFSSVSNCFPENDFKYWYITKNVL
ncbi:hypothetical protein EXU57_06715 [Segetibacter sp. 3557_3]|uniref:hypothetical protein n=1 Tax=Segetibacter sp. 3557_3 TaxID=2547429 RepID=UPI0010591EAC|nr:hypothetical protein [Segetibacter sp. 3557_3]TDH27277.1 hypothetical protein EXU57_06715 [Segetibacter sp. 3557_3]